PLTVTVNPKPSLILNSPAAVCEPLTVDLTTEAITNGSTSGLQFSYWTDANATVSYLTPATASTGNYYIKGVDSNGCSSISGPLTVTVNPKPSVVLTNPSPVVYPATVGITNTAITFGSTEGLIYSYWLDSDATLIYATPQTATAGDYFIKGTVDLTGCYTIAGPLTVTITTSDNIDLFDQIKVYSYDKNIVFENCAENSIVSIYDITGKNIYNGMVKSRKETVPFNFNTGIYIVNVRSAQNVKSFKVLLR
ncbi:MAG: T9SS type A sorting domain-containing protein, partial [Bacteroidales bacterium]